jgi:hypothetical protein
MLKFCIIVLISVETFPAQKHLNRGMTIVLPEKRRPDGNVP